MSLPATPPDPMPASGAVAAPPAPPGAPPIAPASTPGGPRGSHPPRLSRQRPLVLFAIGFAVILVVVLVIVVAFAPKPPTPRCPDPNQPCSPISPSQQPVSVGGGLAVDLPPLTTSTAPVLRNGTTWTDSVSGVQFDYDSELWTLDTTTPAGLALLTAGQGSIVLRIEVDSATDVDAPTLLSALEQFTAGIFTGVAPDTSPANRPLHPQIGYKDALGEYLVGTSSEGGQITNLGFMLVTASDPTSNATIGVLVAVPEPDRLAGSGAGAPRIMKLVDGLVDEVMRHVYWTPPQ